jgi:beta-lactamase regulating signal transducer with metallopeptidase domain
MTFDALLPASSWTAWMPVIDTIAKATVILALAGLTTTLLRRTSAAARHLVWTAALLAVLVLPALTLALPRWELPLVKVPAPPVATSTANASVAVEAPAASGIAAPDRRSSREASSVLKVEATQPQSEAAAPLRSTFTWPQIALAIWAAGAALVVGRLLLGFLAVQLLARRTEPAVSSSWMTVACALAREIGVRRVAFRRSARTSMPIAFGILQPTVVMPADADEWPADRLRIVLLHELAHVKRLDCATHMLAQLACAAYWFNPLAWIAARRIRTERERACDDLVLAAGTAGPDYADQLLEIARAMRTARFSVAAGASLAMAHRSQLEGRLMAILDPSIPRGSVSRFRGAIAAAAVAAALVPLASMQTWSYRGEAAALAPDMTGQSQAAPQPVAQPTPTPKPAPAPAANQGQLPGALQGQMQGVAQSTVQGALQGAVQGVVQGVTQGAIQGATQGALQGATQGAVQGATQGAVQGATQGAIQGAMHGRFGENVTQASQDKDADDDQEGRRKADPKLVAALTAALKDTDKEVRAAAMHALVQMRDPSIFEPLLLALKDTNADVRKDAVFGLGQMRDKRAVEPLIAALKDSDADVREQAAFALGQLRASAAVDALAAAVRDTSGSVREQAVFALGQIRDPRAVEPLISALKDTTPDVRKQAAFALGQLRASGAVEALVVALKDANHDVREQAAFALGQLRDPRAIDGLTTALKDAHASVRQQAAFALGQIAR